MLVSLVKFRMQFIVATCTVRVHGRLAIKICIAPSLKEFVCRLVEWKLGQIM